ncbi:TPA: Cro/CI family transcriptional regulator [Klebsiella quasipneumoniae subsp. similipneumoniae]|uniref:Cro/CI family transcriptional regulator n=1 Tax=Klebsiella quasipneumoniae TaxID=1463165 RepID=UPI00272FCD7F|nr:Cro/CI family transcriptional regulator [Klebsiella quasipneumoniae]MDP1297922.1 Cro/CI family transcriptional regulator [Klebsiella quasipneumoniae]
MTMQEAVELFGNKQKLADFFGISKSAVSQWGDKLPPLREIQLETSPKVKRLLRKKVAA